MIAEDGTSMKLKDAMAKPSGTPFHTHTIQVRGECRVTERARERERVCVCVHTHRKIEWRVTMPQILFGRCRPINAVSCEGLALCQRD